MTASRRPDSPLAAHRDVVCRQLSARTLLTLVGALIILLSAYNLYKAVL
jgi:hypothetical protein